MNGTGAAAGSGDAGRASLRTRRWSAASGRAEQNCTIDDDGVAVPGRGGELSRIFLALRVCSFASIFEVSRRMLLTVGIRKESSMNSSDVVPGFLRRPAVAYNMFCRLSNALFVLGRVM